MPSLKSRLRLYSPLGAKGSVLRTLGHDATLPFGDVSTAHFSVSERVSGELASIVEAALEVRGEGGWIEARGGRFLFSASDKDRVAVAGVRSFGGVNLLAYLMRKCLVEPGEAELVDGKRRFNSSTPGQIIKTLFDEGQDRGWGPGLSIDFGNTTDSNGDAWAVDLSIGYEPGKISLAAVLQNLYDQGIVDYWTEGRTLRVFNAGLGVDRSATVLATPLTAMPIKESLDSLVTDAVLYGDDGFTMAVNNAGAISTLGRLETAISQGGVSDSGTATILLQRLLDEGAAVRRQIGSTIDFSESYVGPIPLLDYQGGDWIGAPGEADGLRVREIVVIKTIDKTTASTVLNDRILDAQERQAKRVAGISGGAVIGGAGGPVGPDRRQPKAPTGVVASAEGYWADGITPLTRVSVEWIAVTQGLNDVSIDVDHYEVWARPDDGATESNLAATALGTKGYISGLDPDGDDLKVKVRAISDNNVPGPFSSEVTVAMESPTLALGAPSAPILGSYRGTGTVTWLGTMSGGGGAPADLSQVFVQTSDNSSTGFSNVGFIPSGGGIFPIANLDVGAAPWVRFQPIDRLGRTGTPSAAVQFDPIVGVTELDIVAAGINPDHIQQSEAMWVKVLGGHKIIADELDVGTVSTAVIQAANADLLALIASRFSILIPGALNDLQAQVDAQGVVTSNVQTAFDFTASGLQIGQSGSTLYSVFSNAAVEFWNGDPDAPTSEKVAWLSGAVWNAKRIKAELHVQIGGWLLEADDDGGLSFSSGAL